MERLDKLQLNKLAAAGVITGAIATKTNGLYNLIIETPKQAFVLKSQRDDVRLFKTITSVQSLLESVSIKTFTVVG